MLSCDFEVRLSMQHYEPSGGVDCNLYWADCFYNFKILSGHEFSVCVLGLMVENSQKFHSIFFCCLSESRVQLCVIETLSFVCMLALCL